MNVEKIINKTHHRGPVKNMLGLKVGRLRIIEREMNDKNGSAMWRCRCECGKETVVRGAILRNGNTKSCGCFHRDQTQKAKRISPYKWILSTLRAKSKGREPSSLTYNELLDFVKITKCHYCGSDITWNEYTRINKQPSSRKYNLDRVDNSKGYSKENCVVCCVVCNHFKGDRFTHDEMLELGKTFGKLRELRKQQGVPWIKAYSERVFPNSATSLTNSS